MPETGTPAKPTSPGWEIVSQIRRTRAGPTGRLQPGYVVHFTTTTGVTSTVWVPDSTYTKAKVRAIIAPIAANIADVGSLTG